MTGVSEDTVRAFRFRTLAWSAIASVALIGLTALVLARSGEPFAIDRMWLARVLDSRVWLPAWPSLALNWVGGGLIAIVVIPVVVILLLALVLGRRYWGAAYFAAASALGAGSVQLMKNTVERARPGEMLVQSDFGAFPSGHAANAAVIAVVMAVLFTRTWVIVLGALYTIMMMASRTFLGAHWLSDTFAGVLVGAIVALALAAVLARPLLKEQCAPHQPLWAAGRRHRADPR